MTVQTRLGFIVCVGFVVIFAVLIAHSGLTPPPGDDGSFNGFSQTEHTANEPGAARGERPWGDLASEPESPVRRVPPLMADRPKSTDAQQDGERQGSGVPDAAYLPEGQESAPKKVYVVRKGDTLSRIARRFYGESGPELLDWIVRFNEGRIKEKNQIVAGQEILIPPPVKRDQ